MSTPDDEPLAACSCLACKARLWIKPSGNPGGRSTPMAFDLVGSGADRILLFHDTWHEDPEYDEIDEYDLGEDFASFDHDPAEEGEEPDHG
jgi:hypothetical protein